MWPEGIVGRGNNESCRQYHDFYRDVSTRERFEDNHSKRKLCTLEPNSYLAILRHTSTNEFQQLMHAGSLIKCNAIALAIGHDTIIGDITLYGVCKYPNPDQLKGGITSKLDSMALKWQ